MSGSSDESARRALSPGAARVVGTADLIAVARREHDVVTNVAVTNVASLIAKRLCTVVPEQGGSVYMFYEVPNDHVRGAP